MFIKKGKIKIDGPNIEFVMLTSVGLKALNCQIVFFICCFFCLPNLSFSQQGWVTDLPTIGTFSSARVTDLNADVNK